VLQRGCHGCIVSKQRSPIYVLTICQTQSVSDRLIHRDLLGVASMRATVNYHPVNADQNEIRLISILPPESQPEEPDTIHCKLEHVSLDNITADYKKFVDAADSKIRRDLLLEAWMKNRADVLGLPPNAKLPWTAIGRFTWIDYIALSYTWGDVSTTETILINGELFEATRNLHSALSHFHASRYFEMGLKFWDDSICINQKDVRERNLQVQRMQDIYGKAFNTFAWLGPKADDSARAIAFLDLLAKGQGALKILKHAEGKPYTSDYG
jgi:hypothetical protein